jgi:hypothetical protein
VSATVSAMVEGIARAHEPPPLAGGVLNTGIARASAAAHVTTVAQSLPL